jgi:hypothetical protein
VSSWFTGETESPDATPTDSSTFGPRSRGPETQVIDRPEPSTSSTGAANGTAGGTYMAMPRLMGQPAYARPPRPLVAATPRPFDPDDLPLERFRTDDERDLARVATEAWQHARDAGTLHGASLQPSSSGGIRAIAARLLRSAG